MATEPTQTTETPAAKRPSEDASDETAAKVPKPEAEPEEPEEDAGPFLPRYVWARQLFLEHEVTPAADVQLEWRKPDEAKLREKTAAAFACYDLDGSGAVTDDELRKHMRLRGYTDEEVAAALWAQAESIGIDPAAAISAGQTGSEMTKQ